mgnify:CR=1 FL=1
MVEKAENIHKLRHDDVPFFRSGEVVDRHGRIVKHFRDVPKVLQQLQADGYIIAVASRSLYVFYIVTYALNFMFQRFIIHS